MDFNKFNLELSLDKNPIEKKSLEFQLGETTELNIKLKRNDTVISGYTGCTVKLICSNGKVMYEQKNTDSTNPLTISGDTIAAKLTSNFTSLGCGKVMCEVYVIDSNSNTSISERFIIEVISTNYGYVVSAVDSDANLYARMEKILDAYDNGTLPGVGSANINDTTPSTTTTYSSSKIEDLVDSIEGGVSSYNDLTDKPTIPSKTSQLQNDSGFLTAHQDISGKANKTNSLTASTDLNTADYMPFYDVSASTDKKTTMLTIATILKAYYNATNAMVSKSDIQTMIDTKFNSIVNGNEVSY